MCVYFRGAIGDDRQRSESNRSNDGFSSKQCVRWFKEYTTIDDEAPDVIGPEGIERLCRDLDVEPENVVMLGEEFQLMRICDAIFNIHFLYCSLGV